MPRQRVPGAECESQISHEKKQMVTKSIVRLRSKGAPRASEPRPARALGNAGTASKIRFRARLLRPVGAAKAVAGTFLTLPREASAKLPSRGLTSIEGALNGLAFRAMLEPDGR